MHFKTVLALLVVISVISVFFYMGFKEQIDSVLTGLSTARVYIYRTLPYNCSINLTQGMNLVSFYCIADKSALNSTLKDINNNTLNYSAIYSYGSDEASDPWGSYSPLLPNWTVQTLNEIDRKHGYVIIMNQNQTFFNQGYHFRLTQMNLKKGWNLVSYPVGIEKNLSDVLASIEGNYTMVKTFRDGEWIYYNPLTNQGNLSVMKPGEAYWINLTQALELVVNW